MTLLDLCYSLGAILLLSLILGLLLCESPQSLWEVIREGLVFIFWLFFFFGMLYLLVTYQDTPIAFINPSSG